MCPNLVSSDVKIELMAGASHRQAPTHDVLTSMDPARLHHFCLAAATISTRPSPCSDSRARTSSAGP
jgi:hypothetical protein